MKKKLAELARLRALAKSIIDNAEATAEELAQADEAIEKAVELQAEIKGMEERAEKLLALESFEPKPQRKAKTDPAEATKVAATVATKPDEFKNFGEFIGSVIHAGRVKDVGGSIDNRLLKAPSGLNEATPSDGGFLVQTDHVNALLQRSYDSSVIATRAQRFPISATSNSLTINAIDETSRETGSRLGGVQVYWENEADLMAGTKPKFRQMRLNLHKVAGVCYLTEELMQDTVALEAWVSQGFSDELAFALDLAIYNGTGAGQPLGILNGACLVSVSAETGQAATTIVYENIVNMWARMWGRSRPNAVWFYNQDIEPQLHTMALNVGTGGVPVYMPAGGASASPYGTLYGRPCIPIEQASTLGTVGDIMLADMSQYMIIDKGGVKASSSAHVRFLYDEETLKFTYRVDGQPAWNAALTPYSGSGNTLSPFVVLASRT